MKFSKFIREYGTPYSTILGLDLRSRNNEEIIKWFLASLLYSKPIRESSATKTFRCFERNGIYSAKKIINAGWNRLVSILDEGGYTRYDFSTATKLLEVFKNLDEKYSGDLNQLYKKSIDEKDLERRLRDLGKGIGDTTISIFLRDMRIIWKKAKPRPSNLVKIGMKEFKIKNIERFAKKNKIDLIALETALLRYAKNFLKRRKKLDIEIIS